jgi:hypothetical protein
MDGGAEVVFLAGTEVKIGGTQNIVKQRLYYRNMETI